MVNDSLFKAHIATHLKALRQQKRMSLDAAAQATGVSKAMLGQIEREESSPTIATLWKIASGLETSFSAFFAQVPVLPPNESTFPDDKNMHVEIVFPFAPDTGLEMLRITLTQHHQQMSTPHRVGVVEYVLVIEGELNLFFDGRWQSLQSGDTIRFSADQPHGYHAVTEKVVFQNVIIYPT